MKSTVLIDILQVSIIIIWIVILFTNITPTVDITSHHDTDFYHNHQLMIQEFNENITRLHHKLQDIVISKYPEVIHHHQSKGQLNESYELSSKVQKGKETINLSFTVSDDKFIEKLKKHSSNIQSERDRQKLIDENKFRKNYTYDYDIINNYNASMYNDVWYKSLMSKLSCFQYRAGD